MLGALTMLAAAAALRRAEAGGDGRGVPSEVSRSSD
jgi:hypothetical protein